MSAFTVGLYSDKTSDKPDLLFTCFRKRFSPMLAMLVARFLKWQCQSGCWSVNRFGWIEIKVGAHSPDSQRMKLTYFDDPRLFL